MKKLIVFVLVLGLCGTVQAALVSQWKFDGDLTDASGNGHHGSAAGGPLTYIAGAPYGADPGGQALAVATLHCAGMRVIYVVVTAGRVDLRFCRSL